MKSLRITRRHALLLLIVNHDNPEYEYESAVEAVNHLAAEKAGMLSA